MDLSKYQSRVVYDAIGYSDLDHVLHALTIADGELSRWCSTQMLLDAPLQYVDPNNTKVAEYIGNIWYWVAMITSLLGIPLEALEQYSKIVDDKGRHCAYWALKLSCAIGELHGVYVEHVESGGASSIKEIRSIPKWEYGDNIRSRIADQCVLVMHVLYRLQSSLHITTETILENDVRRRYGDACDQA